MPIPKWCDPKTIRTVKSGKARVLVCCPKKKSKSGRCRVGMRAFGSALSKGAAKEGREHPWASKATARRIASDHLRSNPRAYGEVVLPKTANGQRVFDHPRGGTIIVMRGSQGYNVRHREAKWGPHDAATAKRIIAALRAGTL